MVPYMRVLFLYEYLEHAYYKMWKVGRTQPHPRRVRKAMGTAGNSLRHLQVINEQSNGQAVQCKR